MPRVHHVKKARKDVKGTDIKAGESYYWWKFRVGRGSIKRTSRTRPKPSQLTLSEFYGGIYDFEEQAQGFANDLRAGTSPEDAASNLRSLADDVRSFGEEQQEKKDNMPENLQYSATAELLDTRAERCEEIASELESAADELESLEAEEDCPDCNGEGTVDCENCPEGENASTCTYCSGDGRADCDNCNGTGKVESDMDDAAGNIEAIDWSVE